MPKNVLHTSTGWCGWTQEHDASCATAVFNTRRIWVEEKFHSMTVRMLHNDILINQELERN